MLAADDAQKERQKRSNVHRPARFVLLDGVLGVVVVFEDGDPRCIRGIAAVVPAETVVVPTYIVSTPRSRSDPGGVPASALRRVGCVTGTGPGSS